MKKAKSLLALALAVTMILSGCGGGNNNAPADNGNAGGDSAAVETQTEGIKDLVTFETSNREMEGVFIINSEKASDLNVLCNCVAGLLENDNHGKLTPGVATEWSTEDEGKTWIFKLRDDVKWVDVNGVEKAACTAQDWVTAMEWIMNYHKNSAANTSMPTDTIEGAEDYYNYTKELDAAEAFALDTSKFSEMVGVEAVDDYTLKYTCKTTIPYFPTLCTCACMYPVSQAWLDEVGVENVLATGCEGLWYTGPYTLTSFIQGNEKILTRNPLYYDTQCSLFDTVTIKIIEDLTVGFQLYQTGEIDHMDLSEANLRTIYDDENNEFHDQLAEKMPRKYSYQFKFNYDKRLEDGSSDTNWNTAIANENFRKSLYYGLDLTNYWSRTNFIYPEHCENLTYTMSGLVSTSDGRDYTDLVKEKLDFNAEEGRYNADKAAECKAAAIEELTAKGVTFPVQIDYYIISGSQNALDSATVMKEIFSNCLGDDYVNLNIKTFVSSQTQEVVNPRLHSFVSNGWGADYGDVQNFLGQETYGEDTAYYSNNYTFINDATDEDLIALYKEYTDLVNAADAITDDMDARYEAYSVAEAFMLNHAMTVPNLIEVSWELSHVNDYSRPYALYGINNFLYKNWETSVEAYNTDQYNAFREEYYK